MSLQIEKERDWNREREESVEMKKSNHLCILYDKMPRQFIFVARFLFANMYV